MNRGEDDDEYEDGPLALATRSTPHWMRILEEEVLLAAIRARSNDAEVAEADIIFNTNENASRTSKVERPRIRCSSFNSIKQFQLDLVVLFESRNRIFEGENVIFVNEGSPLIELNHPLLR
jgi:hypothetical protein